jgi:hypothetical protein
LRELPGWAGDQADLLGQVGTVASPRCFRTIASAWSGVAAKRAMPRVSLGPGGLCVGIEDHGHPAVVDGADVDRLPDEFVSRCHVWHVANGCSSSAALVRPWVALRQTFWSRMTIGELHLMTPEIRFQAIQVRRGL